MSGIFIMCDSPVKRTFKIMAISTFFRNFFSVGSFTDRMYTWFSVRLFAQRVPEMS